MKRVLTVILAAAMCFAAMCCAAFAQVAPNALNDGTYNIEVESSASMFKVVNCDITVASGKITAAVTLSGTGYGKLFVGTGEQALAASEAEYIPFSVNADGQYVYSVPINALDAEIAVAAWSIKNEQWYDRTLVFKSEGLPESAYKTVTAAPENPEKPNPDTGTDIAAVIAVAAGALTAAVIFGRKRSRA